MEESAATSIVEVTVDMPERVWQQVVRLAELQKVSETELLRRSISIMAFVQTVVENKGQLLVERADGSVDRVILPYWRRRSGSEDAR